MTSKTRQLRGRRRGGRVKFVALGGDRGAISEVLAEGGPRCEVCGASLALLRPNAPHELRALPDAALPDHTRSIARGCGDILVVEGELLALRER
jgi:hypothetical protein